MNAPATYSASWSAVDAIECRIAPGGCPESEASSDLRPHTATNAARATTDIFTIDLPASNRAWVPNSRLNPFLGLILPHWGLTAAAESRGRFWATFASRPPVTAAIATGATADAIDMM